MLYRRATYKIVPNQYEPFTRFFHEYVLPIQLAHGVRLAGHYTTLDHTEVVTIWEYDSYEDYLVIDRKINESTLYKKSLKAERLYHHLQEDFLEEGGGYHLQKHIVSVSGCFVNEKGEVLLVQNEHRPDTYEMPGGRLENNESLEEAIKREVLEETGVFVKVEGITGVYHNMTLGVVCIVFKGTYHSGEIRPQPGETKNAVFQKMTDENRRQWITREHFLIRLEDALKNEGAAVESYYVKPYTLVHRLESYQ
ncbi:NUDIX domain-containing protein [Halobacillus amylolyticus]|uniref:NUDIX domain-containing protein n=1 Tax=Halobacillus amylolyticus TaxID=2932259 RepID=A0ABY4HGC5_9BACI|nr:NUDIX domain-containing protein [Halobacillus amylolyticus]UOR13338.1 NUDIX domain-containing protein [Halobacillus amylolyticus]